MIEIDSELWKNGREAKMASKLAKVSCAKGLPDLSKMKQFQKCVKKIFLNSYFS